MGEVVSDCGSWCCVGVERRKFVRGENGVLHFGEIIRCLSGLDVNMTIMRK
jgi:hypothetical protein